MEDEEKGRHGVGLTCGWIGWFKVGDQGSLEIADDQCGAVCERANVNLAGGGMVYVGRR